MTSLVASTEPSVGVVPGAIPVLGHAVKLARRPLELLNAAIAGPDLMELRLGPQRALLVCAPELAHQMLVKARIFDKGGRFFEKIRQGAGDGLVSSEWLVHRRHRPLIQPAFHPHRLATYPGVMAKEITDMTASWHSGDQIEVGTAMQQYTMRVLIRTLFFAPAAAPFLDEIGRCAAIVLRGAYWRAMNPADFIERLPLPANRRHVAAIRRLRGIVETIVEGYRQAGTDHGDVLSMLLHARDENTGDGLTDTEITDHVYTLLIAGTETTASVLSWVFYLLGRNPDARERLHAELDALPPDQQLDMRTVGSLDYTRRVVTETLRLYPAAWLLARMTTTDCELGPYRIPSDTMMFYSPYLLHRRPDVFADPERFDPDRWLPERAAALPRGAFVPFGGGSRKCIGDNFGLIEATIALVAIARDWVLEPIDDVPVRPVPKISLAPGRLPMTLHARRHGSVAG